MTTESLLEQLKAAKVRLERLQDAWEQYDGNNPNKYRTSISDARAVVAELEGSCKEAGLLPMTPEEQLWARINQAYPAAASRQVVEFEGRHYMRRFTPVSKSLSGKTVKAWAASWEELEAESDAVARFLAPAPTEEEIALNGVLRAAWPFSIPMGGLVLHLREGSPAVTAEVTKVAIAFNKGMPDLRAQLKAQVWATSEAITQMRTSVALGEGAAAESRKELFLGMSPDGVPLYLRKKGAGHKGLYVAK